MTGVRVAIAGDSAVLRDGLMRLLDDRGFVVTAAVGDGDALLAAIDADRPTWP